MSKPPDLSLFQLFIDRNIDSLDICAILAKAGLSVQRHKDHFDPEEDDDVWIAAVSNQNWIILSADLNIESDHLDAMVQSKAKLILLVGKRSGAVQWASSVVVARDRVFQLLADHDGPMVIRLGKSGEIKTRLADEVCQRQRKIETAKITRGKRRTG